MNRQKKLVEALRVFMEKGVIPALGEEHPSLNQWKYLSGILTADTIDPSQLDFYLLMASKAGNSGIKNNSSSLQKQAPSHHFSNDRSAPNSYGSLGSQGSQKSSMVGESRRKNLLASMQNFQNTMIKNQEKLQSFSKKDNNSSAMLNVSSNTSYTTTSKKFI